MRIRNYLNILYKLCQRVSFALIIATISRHSIANTTSERPILPYKPNIAADYYLLMDYDSDKILASKNIDKLLPPASITKMMTMYVVDQEIKDNKLKLDDMITISRRAWQAPGSRMFVEVGKQVKVSDLIKGVIIQSGNDASISLAEHIAGSEAAFTELMNYYARQLGMQNSHFSNATGLPDSTNRVTVRDLSILSKAVIRDFPESYKVYAQKEFTYNKIRQTNRNLLLWRNDTVDGIKTGHTDNAGYCLVSSAKRDNMRLIAVVMGAKSMNSSANESNKLLTWGFRFFETYRLYQAGESIENIKIWMGNKSQLDVGFSKDLYVTIPRSQYNKLTASADIPSVIKAPIKAGTQLGMYKVKLQNEIWLERPIIALKDVNSGNLWHQVRDSVILNAKSLWDKMVS